jgi:FtsH-binding integral membrane protein
MGVAQRDWYREDVFAADAALDERLAFLRRTYAHVFGATAVFAGLLWLLVTTPELSTPIARAFFGGGWWAIMIGFMAVGYLTQKMAASQAGPAVQYAGLGIYAVAEAVFFTPLMLLVTRMPNGAGVVNQAVLLTLIIFGGLTVIVFVTKQDFSFLKGILTVLAWAAIGLMVVAMFTSLSLGTWFVAGMVVLMGGFILYETSNVLHHYPTNMHVAAALALFSSLTTLFWYVLRLTSIMSSDD